MIEGFDGSCETRDMHAKPDGEEGGENFQRRSKCLFLRTSKLGHLCASSSALWRAPENVKHVNFTQYWKSIVFLNNSAISFSLVSDIELISLSDGDLFTDFFVLVHLNDKYLY